MVQSGSNPGPRERLLVAAQELMYTRGATVGVDAILDKANVARRSLYEHFGGKHGLVAAVLQRASDEDVAWYEAALASGGDDPRARLLALFNRLDQLVSVPEFRGCRYLAADLALADPEHPAHSAANAYRQRIHALLTRELRRLGHARPSHGADQVQLLIEGTLAVGATRARRHPARVARELLLRVLDG